MRCGACNNAADLHEEWSSQVAAGAQLQLCHMILLSDRASCFLCNRLPAGASPLLLGVFQAVSSIHTHQQVLLRVKCDKAKAAGAMSHLVQHNCSCLGVEGPEGCSSNFVLSMHALQLRAVLPGAAGYEARCALRSSCARPGDPGCQGSGPGSSIKGAACWLQQC